MVLGLKLKGMRSSSPKVKGTELTQLLNADVGFVIQKQLAPGREITIFCFVQQKKCERYWAELGEVQLHVGPFSIACVSMVPVSILAEQMLQDLLCRQVSLNLSL